MRFTAGIIVVALALVNVRERRTAASSHSPLGPVVGAKAGETFGTIVGVRATSGGVLVNEASARRVVPLDAMAFAGGPLGSASFHPAGRKGGRSSGSAAAGQCTPSHGRASACCSRGPL